MIKIYASAFDKKPTQTMPFEGTVAEFLLSQNVDESKWYSEKAYVSVNGETIHPDDYKTTEIDDSDDVEIKAIAQGGIVNFIRKIDPLLGFFLKGAQQQKVDVSQNNGQKLEESKVKANTPKLNEVVPELLGRYVKYPDYLTPPRRVFLNQREQWVEFLCCVGPGSYQINPEDIKIGSTMFSSIGEDAQYRIFQPGESMAGHAAQDIWYTAPEVSGTSSGSAGLEIPIEYTGAPGGDTLASEYLFNGNQITITQPADGHWADGIRAGTRITEIKLPLPYDVTTHVVTPGQPEMVNRFTGNFQEILPIAIGDRVNVEYNGNPVNPGTGTLVAAMSLAPNGTGWIELKSGIGDFPIDAVPNGTQFMVFRTGVPHRYEVFGREGKLIGITKYAGSPVSLPVQNWQGFANVTSTSATITADSSSFAGDWTPIYSAVPKGKTTTNVELDFFFRGGLATSDGSDISTRSVTLDIAYRDQDIGGPFTIVSRTFTAATLDDIGFTESFTMPAMRPEFQVRRQGIGSADSNNRENVDWYGMRSYMMAKTSYPELTAMYVRVRSGGKLAAAAEDKVNVVATRILPIIQADGSFGSPIATQSISSAFYYIAQSIGYTTGQVDVAELLRLHYIWEGRGDTFGFVFGETTVKEAMNRVLAVGFSELTIDNGLLKPVRDEPRTVYEQSYSPQNTTGPITRAWKNRRHDDIDGVEVEYTNTETWETETVDCLLPGSLGLKKEKLRADGAKGRDQAWRIGMRRIRSVRYRPWSYSLNTELDALNSKYWSHIAIIDNIKGYGKSSIMTGISAYNGNAMIMVTEPAEFQPGATHVVAYRNKQGRFVGPFPAFPGPTPYHIEADLQGAGWPEITLKHEPPHVYFGTVEKMMFPALVTEIRPGEQDTARLSATNYADEVYVNDNDSAPPA